MMVVHANPKTHPGGVHGAFSKELYQTPWGPLFINKPPIAREPKLINKYKTSFLRNEFTYFIFTIPQSISIICPLIDLAKGEDR